MESSKKLVGIPHHERNYGIYTKRLNQVADHMWFDVNILTFNGDGTCKRVDSVNIRDYNCSNCTALLFQNCYYPFHVGATQLLCDLKVENFKCVYILAERLVLVCTIVHMRSSMQCNKYFDYKYLVRWIKSAPNTTKFVKTLKLKKLENKLRETGAEKNVLFPMCTKPRARVTKIPSRQTNATDRKQ